MRVVDHLIEVSREKAHKLITEDEKKAHRLLKFANLLVRMLPVTHKNYRPVESRSRSSQSDSWSLFKNN